MLIRREILQKLYTTTGLSVAQIANKLGCSQHKINYWMKHYGISKRTISDALYRRHNPEGDPFLLATVDSIDKAYLAGIGLGLYWDEGNKKNMNSIRLGNTDPFLMRKFISFLENILGVPMKKLRFGLQIFSDIDPSLALQFWTSKFREFGISRNQFQKPVVTPARSLGTYRKKSRYGVLTVYCSNIKLKNILDDMLAKQAI